MFRTRKQKAMLLQLLAGLILIVGLVLFVRYAYLSLQQQNITSGFGFLWRSTGWEIGFSLLPYTINDPYWKVILVGLLNTLFIGSFGLALATVIGLVIGALRTQRNPVLAFMGTCYVEAIRNVPMILQAFFWYAVYTHLPPPREAVGIGDAVFFSARGIFLPSLNVTQTAGLSGGGLLLAGLVAGLMFALAPRHTLRQRMMMPKLAELSVALGIVLCAIVWLTGGVEGQGLVQLPVRRGLNFTGGIRVSPEFAALLTSMSLYGGAFLAEIIRAGFLSVNRGQVEAAQAVGLSGWQVFSRVRLPLAVRAVLPTLTNQYVWLLKATTLGIAVGFSDFFMIISTAINQSGQTLELILILMAGFLVMNNILAAAMNAINRRVALRGTQLRI